jgi:hypothetical protein
MAIINKTGITNGGTIEAEHVTRAIDALSGVSTDSVVATGSFTGSFTGTISTPGTITNSTHYVVVSDSIGTAANVYSDNGLTYNPSTNILTASGSFTGTLTGLASQASTINTTNNSIENLNYYILTTDSSTGYALAYTDSNLRFNPNTNTLILTGSLTTSGSLNMTATPASNVNFSAISSSGQFAIPLVEPASPVIGAMYYDPGSTKLKIWEGSTWQQWIPD